MKKLLLFLGFTLSFNIFAAWQAEVALGIDGETWKIERKKIEEGKEALFDMKEYLVKMTIKKTKEAGRLDVVYAVMAKKKNKQVLVSKGEENINEKKPHDIYAKGEKDQPHSIISIKLKNI